MDVRHAPGSAARLRAELQSPSSREATRATLRQILRDMHHDMAPLMPDLLALDTHDSEAKKLIYLILVNHVRTHADALDSCTAALSRDAASPNPIVRGLAVRTLTNINAPAAAGTLAAALGDADAYVRKNGALCATKLHAADPSVAMRCVPMLHKLLLDPSPAVVANAAAALVELGEHNSGFSLALAEEEAYHLLGMLDQCTEWGQAYILDALVFYTPQSDTEAEQLAERLCARLQQSSSAVVLGAVKVIMFLLNYISSAAFREMLCHRMDEPLVMLLNAPAELQYVALRTILAVVQRRPLVLSQHVHAFFWSPGDPAYIRAAKLDVICTLTSSYNTQVLDELENYGNDHVTLRSVVRAIGHLALRLDDAAERCTELLLRHLDGPVDGAQEAAVCLGDVLRRYPQFGHVAPRLCAAHKVLTDTPSRLALVWTVGQYPERVGHAAEILEAQASDIESAPLELQLALLTACVKLCLARPSDGSPLATRILLWASDDAVHPDLRDRTLMYRRLLMIDPAIAKQVVLTQLPPTAAPERMDRSTLDHILLHGGLGAVFQRLPHTFIRGTKQRVRTLLTVHARLARARDQCAPGCRCACARSARGRARTG